MKKKKYQIGVIGSAGIEEYPESGRPAEGIYKTAYILGKLIAQQGAVLITGGKGGIMESASKGAKDNNGITIGFVKGKKRNTSNQYVDIEIVSGMEGCGEETMLVLSCDGILAIGGGAGTLQELTIAYRNKKPVVVISNYSGVSKLFTETYMDNRKLIKFYSASSEKKAVELLFSMLK